MDTTENLSLRDKIEWIIKELRKLKIVGKIAYDHSQATGNPHNTTKSDIGLGNVNNTSDLNKPISTATQNALNNKLDKGTYDGNAQDLKNDIDGKANSVDVSAVLALKADKSTTYTKSEVDTKLEEAIYYSIIY